MSQERLHRGVRIVLEMAEDGRLHDIGEPALKDKRMGEHVRYAKACGWLRPFGFKYRDGGLTDEGIKALWTDRQAEKRERRQAKAEPASPVDAPESVLRDDVERKIIDIAKSKATANERMREIIRLDRRKAGLSSFDWAKLLGCRDANIRKSDTWREIQKQKKIHE